MGVFSAGLFLSEGEGERACPRTRDRSFRNCDQTYDDDDDVVIVPSRSDRTNATARTARRGRIGRAQRIRRHAHFIPSHRFRMRKTYFSDKENGLLRQKIEVDPMKNPMMSGNPNMMMDMMKGQVFTMLPHIFMVTFVSYVFSGFVLVQIPFPLTNAFRPMLQRGVDLGGALDVSYVSSLSWYFLVMFGMGSLFQLVLGPGDHVVDPMQAQMGMAKNAGGPQQFDPNGPYTREADGLEIVRHDPRVVANIERRLVGFPAVESH